MLVGQRGFQERSSGRVQHIIGGSRVRGSEFPEGRRADVVRGRVGVQEGHVFHGMTEQRVIDDLASGVETVPSGPQDVEVIENGFSGSPAGENFDFIGTHDKPDIPERVFGLDGLQSFQGSAVGHVAEFAGVDLHVRVAHGGQHGQTIRFRQDRNALGFAPDFSANVVIAGRDEDTLVGMEVFHSLTQEQFVGFGRRIERAAENDESLTHIVIHSPFLLWVFLRLRP